MKTLVFGALLALLLPIVCLADKNTPGQPASPSTTADSATPLVSAEPSANAQPEKKKLVKKSSKKLKKYSNSEQSQSEQSK